MIQAQDRHIVYCVKIYGVPTGDDDHVKEALLKKASKIRSKFTRIETKLDLPLFPELQLLIRQCWWLLILICN